MENTEKPANTDAPIPQPRDSWWIRLIRYVKRKMDERAAKKQKEPPMDRAARITAKATVWIAFFTFVSVAVSVFTFLILKSQLREMHDGGIDTHNLAVAAGKQAEAARDQARLLRQQMVGTMGAHIEIGGPELINNKLRIVWIKSGQVIPQEFNASFQIGTATFPSLKPLWKSQVYEVRKKPFYGFREDYRLPDFSKTNQQFDTQKQTITVRGQYEYDNGFGDKFPQPFCSVYMGSYSYSATSGGQVSGGGFIGCEDLKDRLAQISRRELP